VGCNVDPLGEVLIRLFPDGFTLLFAPAAALPAPLPVVVAPVVDPVVVPLAAGAAGAELPPAELVPLCASANVLTSVSAAAKPIVVNFIVSFLSLVTKEKLPRRDRFRVEASTVCGDQGTPWNWIRTNPRPRAS
jgi:hypothetical protein